MPWPTKKSTNNDGERLYTKPDEVIEIEILEDEPELYFTHFINNKTSKCSAPDCAPCLAGEKRSTKGSIKVRDVKDGKEKTLNGTAALFISLKETLDLCGGRNGFIFAIKTTGEKSQRRYTIVNKPLKQSTPKMVATTDEVPF